MKPHAVVVGAGITGAFAAYFLVQRGAQVTLVERGGLGEQASGNNPGHLAPLHGPGIPGPMSAFALVSFRLHLDSWDAIRKLSATEFFGAPSGRVSLALDEADVTELEHAKEPYDSTPGFSATWLEPAQVLEMESRASPAIVRGLRLEGSAKVDAGSYTRAVAEAALKLGARLLPGQVQGLQRSGTRATHVLVGSEPVACDAVVIATGPWSAEPARWLDTHLPVEPLKGELLQVEAQAVSCDFVWRDAAVYAAARGDVWLGGTEEQVGFDRTPTDAGRASILERALRLMPGLRDARVRSHTAGLRPVTPDGLPIVGLAGGWENVCLAMGGGRKGMLLGTGMGRAAADLVTAGGTRLPIDPCSPARHTAGPIR